MSVKVNVIPESEEKSDVVVSAKSESFIKNKVAISIEEASISKKKSPNIIFPNIPKLDK